MTNNNLLPRKIFSVYINDIWYQVYDISGKEHQGLNGEPKTWWLYYADSLPEGIIPPYDSENFIPWQNSINRSLWDISYKQKTVSKFKWDEYRFSTVGMCEMRYNGKLIYSFFSRTVEYALSKAGYLTVNLLENPGFNFLEAEKENGRKIWWHGLPATIKTHEDESWNISIIPDYTTGFSKEQWWKEYNDRTSKIVGPQKEYSDEEYKSEREDDMSEQIDQDYINWGDALQDRYIDWFRK